MSKNWKWRKHILGSLCPRWFRFHRRRQDSQSISVSNRHRLANSKTRFCRQVQLLGRGRKPECKSLQKTIGCRWRIFFRRKRKRIYVSLSHTHGTSEENNNSAIWGIDGFPALGRQLYPQRRITGYQLLGIWSYTTNHSDNFRSLCKIAQTYPIDFNHCIKRIHCCPLYYITFKNSRLIFN